MKNSSYCLLFFFCKSLTFEISSLQNKIENGKLHYEVYSKSGNCWEKAVNSMISTCEEMDEFTQSLFAAKLTNCHLKRLGLKEISCEIGKGCDLDSNSYIAYTQFFTHSFDICVYVSYQNWHSKTQKTIQNLASAAEISLKTLDESHGLVKNIYDKQEDVKNQINKNIELNKELQKQLFISTNEIQDFAKNFMNTSKAFYEQMNKQQEFLAKWVGKIYESVVEIGYVQEIIMHEVWDLNSVLFYMFFFIFFVFSTSFPETYSARSRIFWLLLLNIGLEKIFHYNYKQYRSFFVIFCCFLLVISVKKYREYDKLNYEMLRDVIFKIGNKALIAITPTSLNFQTKPLKSPLKEQCLNRLSKIAELPSELEHDAQKNWKKIDKNNTLSQVFQSLSEKKLKQTHNNDLI